MIKRLDLSPYTMRSDDWAEWRRPDPRSPHLFVGRPQYRKVKVMVDHELLSVFAIPATPSGLLSEMCRSRFVDVVRYSDTGPPADVVPLEGGRYEGWAVVREQEDFGWSVWYPSGHNTWSLGGVTGNGVEMAGRDRGSSVYADLSPDDAANRRRADALALGVAAQALGADIYVTDRPYLHTDRVPATAGVACCRVEEAIALLGLYLRAQGEFRLSHDFGLDRGMFFWVGTRELLPEGWRWFSACVYQSTHVGDDSLLYLASALLNRMDRALRTRDRLHVALNRPQTNATIDDVSEALDLLLMLLMGCVDVAARVAHRALSFPGGDEHQAAWQQVRKGGWLSKVRAAAPNLAAQVAPGTDNERTLTVLRLLRNSVHGEALRATLHERVGFRQVTVGVPRHDEAEITNAINQLGGQ